jgi:hypothetical protein
MQVPKSALDGSMFSPPPLPPAEESILYDPMPVIPSAVLFFFVTISDKLFNIQVETKAKFSPTPLPVPPPAQVTEKESSGLREVKALFNYFPQNGTVDQSYYEL